MTIGAISIGSLLLCHRILAVKWIIVGFISGLFWQSKVPSIQRNENDWHLETMSISTGMQLTGVHRCSAGFGTLILIVAGVLFTSREEKMRGESRSSGKMVKGIGLVVGLHTDRHRRNTFGTRKTPIADFFGSVLIFFTFSMTCGKRNDKIKIRFCGMLSQKGVNGYSVGLFL